MLLVYKCCYEVIHRVWRNDIIFWGLLPSHPLSPPPCPSPLRMLLSPHSARHTFSLTKAHTKKQSKKILRPGSQALGRCCGGLNGYGPRSPLQGAGTTRAVCSGRSAPSPKWVNGLTTQLDQCSRAQGWFQHGCCPFTDSAAVDCRGGWDNFLNKTKRDKNKPK